MTFDPASLGLYSHYHPDHCQRLRKLIFADWRKSGVKLPTYMKLVGRYIERTGVPEEWLAKLSYQTMNRVLRDNIISRHELWACIHLYLMKKYEVVDLSKESTVDIGDFDRELEEYTNGASAKNLISNVTRIGDDSAISLTLDKDQECYTFNLNYRFKDKGILPLQDEISAIGSHNIIQLIQDLIGDQLATASLIKREAS